jgi:hypothetical protein
MPGALGLKEERKWRMNLGRRWPFQRINYFLWKSMLYNVRLSIPAMNSGTSKTAGSPDGLSPHLSLYGTRPFTDPQARYSIVTRLRRG